jgi:biopolymer transport protein ExbD
MAISKLPGGDAGLDAEEGGIVAEINVTPLTDIFLVLLIIFMVTTTAVHEEGKQIDLPSATQSETSLPRGVSVQVDESGRIRVNEREVPDGGLLSALEEALAKAEDKVVVLRGDKRVLLGQAVDVLDLAQRAGAAGIAIATQQPADQPRR